jgi:hypothetical protein
MGKLTGPAESQVAIAVADAEKGEHSDVKNLC